MMHPPNRIALTVTAASALVGELGCPAKPGETEARLQPLLDRDRYFLAVASGTDGHLLGLVNAGRRINIESGTSFGLTGLVVASSARRAGVGSALVAAAEEWERIRSVHDSDTSCGRRSTAMTGHCAPDHRSVAPEWRPGSLIIDAAGTNR